MTRPEVPAKPLSDVLAPGLDILFCGIDPSLMSAARGHHFARPGNRFWPALHLAGFTSRRLAPDEDRELLRYGIGVTTLVARPTRTAAELSVAELRDGAVALAEVVCPYRPRGLVVLGVTAWRTAFDRPKATIGRQPERVGAETWVVPNPSGRGAHHQLPTWPAATPSSGPGDESSPDRVHRPGAEPWILRRQETGRGAWHSGGMSDSVVVGWIGTPEGQAAVDAAVEEVRRRHGRLVVVHSARGGRDAEAGTLIEVSDALAELEARLRGEGIDLTMRDLVRGNDPAEDLIEVAHKENAALIVIGLRRRSPVGKLLMGSNAQEILLQADCAVLAVKAP